MVISVIIPTLNEEINLPVTLRQLANHPERGIDCRRWGLERSHPRTAQGFTPYVFRSLPNRASQMNMGARHATGDILLFLYADTFLLPGAWKRSSGGSSGTARWAGRLICISIPSVVCASSSRGRPGRSRWLGCRMATREFLCGDRCSKRWADSPRFRSWKIFRSRGDCVARDG